MADKNLFIGGLAALAIFRAGLLSLEEAPFKLEKVGFGGYTLQNTPEITLVFYDDGGNRFPLKKKDRSFDYENAYKEGEGRIQGKYNISGYRNFWGDYASQIKVVDREYRRDSLKKR